MGSWGCKTPEGQPDGRLPSWAAARGIDDDCWSDPLDGVPRRQSLRQCCRGSAREMWGRLSSPYDWVWRNSRQRVVDELVAGIFTAINEYLSQLLCRGLSSGMQSGCLTQVLISRQKNRLAAQPAQLSPDQLRRIPNNELLRSTLRIASRVGRPPCHNRGFCAYCINCTTV